MLEELAGMYADAREDLADEVARLELCRSRDTRNLVRAISFFQHVERVVLAARFERVMRAWAA